MKSLLRLQTYVPALYFLASMTLLVGLWQLVSLVTKQDIPSPAMTWVVFREMLSNPFYDNGPNDKGIGNQLLSSLGRVFTGYTLGMLVAIPLGLVMGASTVGMRLLNPIVQILRPVSPLAWFPLGLLAFKAAAGATIFIIFITSLWPTLINTAFGVSSIPQDHKNVAKAFGFSTWRYVRRVVLPYALPHIITGMRLSMGVAWLVIVAGEMLSGGVGIGFFVWDSWNALSLEKILCAILLIGAVGLLLDKGFDALQKRFAY